jgi:hypothetical protein
VINLFFASGLTSGKNSSRVLRMVSSTSLRKYILTYTWIEETMEFYIKVNADKSQLQELFGYDLTEDELISKVIEHLYSAGIQDYFECNDAPLRLS